VVARKPNFTILPNYLGVPHLAERGGYLVSVTFKANWFPKIFLNSVSKESTTKIGLVSGLYLARKAQFGCPQHLKWHNWPADVLRKWPSEKINVFSHFPYL